MAGHSRRNVVLAQALMLACLIVTLGALPAVSSSVQSTGRNIIAQHVFVIPTSGEALVNVSLPSPVIIGDLLVVGVVFHSPDVGNVSDSFSDSFSQQLGTASGAPGTNFSCYSCLPELATGIWWSVARMSGNDTISVSSLYSTELVEVFDISGANSTTIGFFGGGGWASTPGLNAITSAVVHDGNAFVFVIGGSVCDQQNSTVGLGSWTCNDTQPETCYPYPAIDLTPAQSPGFTIEPYCGTKSPFTTGLIYGEYGVGNNTGGYSCTPKGNGTSCTVSGEAFTADLGVDPPLAGSMVGQAFYVDPGAVSPVTGVAASTATGSLLAWSFSETIGVIILVVGVLCLLLLLKTNSRRRPNLDSAS